MSSNEIEILNDVTESLIDSYEGYRACAETVDNAHPMHGELSRRTTDRHALVGEFKARVRALGGEPASSGTTTGAIHRGFAKFASLFQDDEDAAVSALDDAEERLGDEIQDKLKDNSLSNESNILMTKALRSAVDGERFADRIDA